MARQENWEGPTLKITSSDDIDDIARTILGFLTSKAGLTEKSGPGELNDDTFRTSQFSSFEEGGKDTHTFEFTEAGADRVRNLAQAELGPREANGASIGSRTEDETKLPFQGKTAIIIDDEDMVRNMLANVLKRRFGFRVIAVARHDDLTKALDPVGTVDFVLSDNTIRNQGYNGVAWIKGIAEGSRHAKGITKNTPVILLTGGDTNGPRAELSANTKAVVVGKPIMPSNLLDPIIEAFRAQGIDPLNSGKPGSDASDLDAGESPRRGRG